MILRIDGIIILVYCYAIAKQSLYSSALRCTALYCTVYHEVGFEVPKIRIDHLRSPGQAPVLCSALENMPAWQDR